MVVSDRLFSSFSLNAGLKTAMEINVTLFPSTDTIDFSEYDGFDKFAELKRALHIMSLVVCSLVSFLGVIGNALDLSG